MEPHAAGHFNREVCQPFYHKGNDCGILLIHGFTGSCAQMRPLADTLAERGYTVRTINLPGHALTEAEMAKANWQQWLHAAKEAAYEMMQEVRVFTVAGHSMGGVLALLIAEQMKPDGCVPICAPTAVRSRLLPLAGLCAPLIPRIPWGEPTERHRHIDSNYNFGYSGFPTAKGADLHRLIMLSNRNLFNIQCPILVVQSDGDETIHLSSADTILENVGSKVRQKLILHDMPHLVPLTPEMPAIANAMDNLIKRISAEKRADAAIDIHG